MPLYQYDYKKNYTVVIIRLKTLTVLCLFFKKESSKKIDNAWNEICWGKQQTRLKRKISTNPNPWCRKNDSAYFECYWSREDSKEPNYKLWSNWNLSYINKREDHSKEKRVGLVDKKDSFSTCLEHLPMHQEKTYHIISKYKFPESISDYLSHSKVIGLMSTLA